jgi:hypothetical protein
MATWYSFMSQVEIIIQHKLQFGGCLVHIHHRKIKPDVVIHIYIRFMVTIRYIFID